MHYIVYNAHEILKLRSIFKRGIEYFLDNIEKLVKITEKKSKKLVKYAPGLSAISAVGKYKAFLCLNSHNQECQNHSKTVILSNLQLKLFIKRIDDESEKMKGMSDSFSALTIHSIFLHLNENINYSHIKIIDKKGKISDCKPFIYNFHKTELKKGMSDEEITDAQTEEDFYEGIVNFLISNPQDAVRYITYDHFPATGNPSPGYEKFVQICAGRTASHECCSLNTKPKCEFLQDLYK
ncbi:MAG: hypothetical protein LBQ94_04720 [Treponema sp.]|jgi:hypothetical protein|nr:hypothetical protein [Treponema sp.]